jgi:hypothetical protein
MNSRKLFWWAILASLFLTAFGFRRAAANSEYPGSGSRFDGPAELPRVYVHSALGDTPTPGRVRLVRGNENLQNALDEASCGDTLKLQNGATFSGLFRLPAKSCDDSHWIVIRTSAPDDSLPREGTRISPCYAGVASLPGRPEFHCTAVRNAMARIVFDGNGSSGPILFSAGANHYRFIGLEVTRAQPEVHLGNLISPDKPETTAHHLVFDRLWVHGTARDETKGGIHLSGTTYVAIVDSYFSDFHCIAREGSCTDAQAINGGTGDAPGGPYEIVNNFLEASGECILFGGARGTTTPADIEIRRNHFFKPMLWKSGQPGFVAAYTGTPFIVKNHFELKNAQRVLFEGNVLENCWGGFTQTGFSIVLTPANQEGRCPDCRVTDITIRYNLIRHVASALGIANVLKKQITPSSGGQRYSIHDLLVDDIDGDAYSGFGVFSLIMSVAPPLKSVHIDHVTAFPQRSILVLKDKGSKIEDFQISNSIFTAGTQPIMSAGGGAENCARNGDDPTTFLNNCFSNPTFKGNVIIGGFGSWPKDNLLVKSPENAGIRNFNGGRGGDYRLCREKIEGSSCTQPSPAIAKGTDGKPAGADIEGIEKATEGVI